MKLIFAIATLCLPFMKLMETIVANSYNLVIKNPNAPENIHEDPVVLLKQYQAAVTQADEARLALKTALQPCLEQSAESGK